jgi:hypothetical protein
MPRCFALVKCNSVLLEDGQSVSTENAVNSVTDRCAGGGVTVTGNTRIRQVIGSNVALDSVYCDRAFRD